MEQKTPTLKEKTKTKNNTDTLKDIPFLFSTHSVKLTLPYVLYVKETRRDEGKKVTPAPINSMLRNNKRTCLLSLRVTSSLLLTAPCNTGFEVFHLVSRLSLITVLRLVVEEVLILLRGWGRRPTPKGWLDQAQPLWTVSYYLGIPCLVTTSEDKEAWQTEVSEAVTEVTENNYDIINNTAPLPSQILRIPENKKKMVKALRTPAQEYGTSQSSSWSLVCRAHSPLSDGSHSDHWGGGKVETAIPTIPSLHLF